MRHLVTLSDKNYLEKGLVLYDSLRNTTETPFTLYYLCLDDETFRTISAVGDSQLIAYHIDEISKEPDFIKLAESNESKPNDYSNFHFALASYITHHLLVKYSFPEIIYVDSDIKFYEDFNILFEVTTGKSIGLILHRHNTFGCHVGCYNVGVIYFRNDDVGFKCLKWWRNCLVDKNNPYFEKYGQVGDQKYLEAFGMLFGSDNICVYDNFIGHGAPWNFILYKYLGNNTINWSGREQKVIFNHFSHFSADFKKNTYKMDRGGEWRGCLYFNDYQVPKEVKAYYDDYYKHHIIVRKKYL